MARFLHDFNFRDIFFNKFLRENLYFVSKKKNIHLEFTYLWSK